MSRITAFVAALAFVASASVATAGGLSAPEEDDDVIVVLPGTAAVSSMGTGAVVAGVAGLVLLGAALSSGSH